MENKRMCVLEENKVCDDCGECLRCDLDPRKICDNCCRCLAIEDEDSEFRSVTIKKDGTISRLKKASVIKKETSKSAEPDVSGDEPYELTPELVDYWEKKLLEYGEAPADDGFGEIDVASRNPVYGKRKKRVHDRLNSDQLK